MSWVSNENDGANQSLISACGDLTRALAARLYKYCEDDCEEEIQEVERCIQQFRDHRA